MKRRTITILVVALLFGTSLAYSADKTIWIGAPIGYSGVMAGYGKMAQRGYDFYKDFVNARGGIKVGGETYKVDIKYYDDKSDAATSAKMVEKMITDDNIKFLMASVGSGPALAVTS